jgi:competence protein ComFC
MNHQNRTSRHHTFSELFLDLFFPNRCRACKTLIDGRHVVCAECFETIEALTNPSHTFQSGSRIASKKTTHLSSLVGYSRYNETMERLINHFKIYPDLILTQFFALRLSRIYHSFFGKNADHDFIVIVPQHRFTRYRRGFDRLTMLGSYLSDQINVPLADRYISKVRWTRPQHKLTEQDRILNITKDDFQISQKKEPGWKKILLLDDVVTTGTTINTCAGVIKSSTSGIQVDGLSISMTQKAEGSRYH